MAILDNFLVVTENPQGTQHQSLARINAHVARYSHQKRRNEWAKVQTKPKEVPIKPRPLQSKSKRNLVEQHERSREKWHSDQDKAKAIQLKRLATHGDIICQKSDSEVSIRELVATNAAKSSFSPGNQISLDSLDPFMRLPVELSERDKGLLQFFLTNGRRMMLRTCAEPRYDTLLELAHKTMYRSTIHLYTHLVLAETMMCRLTQKDAEPSLDQKRRIAYRELYKLLLDEQVPVAEKIFRQSQVLVVDFVTGRRSSASRHADNIDQMILAHGGIVGVWAFAQQRADVVSEPRYPLTMYINSEVQIRTAGQLHNMRRSFAQGLRRMTEWVSKLQRPGIDSEIERRSALCSESRAGNMNRLRPLCTYFYKLIDDQLLSTNPPFKTASAPFACAYGICASFLEYNCSAWQALQYLLKIQEVMMASSDFDPAKPGQMKLDPMIAWHILWLSREEITQVPGSVTEASVVQENEARICQASMDAQKIFGYMPRALRSKITRMLCRIALIVTEEVSSDSLFDEAFLDALSMSVKKKWNEKHHQ